MTYMLEEYNGNLIQYTDQKKINVYNTLAWTIIEEYNGNLILYSDQKKINEPIIHV